jgi:carboxypeptidase family protein
MIGISAGLISISGALYSTALHYVKPAIRQGDIVAVVRQAPSDQPVSDAMVEILTLEGRLVTTLAPKQEGRARQSVNAGPYTVRVSHPKFGLQTKQIQVQAGQTSEVRIVLMARPAPPALKVRAEKKESGIRKFFRTLGFD